LALAVKRVYEKPAHGDGTRVLVNRLWPRGLSKEATQGQLYELMSRKKPDTLLFAWTNLEHKNAVALKEVVERAQSDRDEVSVGK